MTEPVLSVEEVDAFYGNSHVLFGLSLTLRENEVVTLLGRNGAGKSTTLRTIVGLVPPRNGRIMYRDQRISGRTVDQISSMGIKLVPEDRRIFPTLTVDENLQLASRLAGQRARSTEEMYELFPALKPLMDSRGRNLSGGEQQMLTIARALVQNPDVLLLDEPSEGLAPVIVEDLREVLSNVIRRDVTVLLAEQNIRFAFDIAERGYIIDRGQIVFDGEVEELEQNPELLETYLSVSASGDPPST